MRTAIVVMLGAAAASAARAGIDDKKVMCGDTQLGVMSMSEYKTQRANQDSSDPLGGCVIDGKFTRVYDKPVELHFLQVTSSSPSSDSFRWIKDTSVSLPGVYIDTPPGGYAQRLEYKKDFEIEDPHDYLPWYDAGEEFPDFHDRPLDSLAYAQDSDTRKFVNTFETWLVGVIKSTPGDEAEQAQDDTYRIAPLLGWSWGFTVQWNDEGINRGYDITTRPFAWIDSPTAFWKDALGAKFGGETKDWFNLQLGAPSELLPAPATLPVLFLGLAGARRRR